MINRKKGFTLIELLVVIAIIGILSSVVLASLNSARQKSRDARRISDMKQVQLALELYFDSANGYITETTPVAVSSLSELTAANYISTLPTDPLSSNTEYSYISADGSSYCVGAVLEDSNHAQVGSSCDATGDDLGATYIYRVGP